MEECSTGTIQGEQKPAQKLSSAFYQMLVFQTIRGERGGTIATGEALVWGVGNITEASVSLFILSAQREEMKLHTKGLSQRNEWLNVTDWISFFVVFV